MQSRKEGRELTTPNPIRPKPRSRPEAHSRIKRHPDDGHVQLLGRFIQTPDMRQVSERGDPGKGEVAGLAVFAEPGVFGCDVVGGLCVVVAVSERKRQGGERQEGR